MPPKTQRLLSPFSLVSIGGRLGGVFIFGLQARLSHPLGVFASPASGAAQLPSKAFRTLSWSLGGGGSLHSLAGKLPTGVLPGRSGPYTEKSLSRLKVGRGLETSARKGERLARPREPGIHPVARQGWARAESESARPRSTQNCLLSWEGAPLGLKAAPWGPGPQPGLTLGCNSSPYSGHTKAPPPSSSSFLHSNCCSTTPASGSQPRAPLCIRTSCPPRPRRPPTSVCWSIFAAESV